MTINHGLRFLMVALFSFAPFGDLFAASTVDAYDFPNETLRERFQALNAELRCPKCQNTNIAGSDAPIAKDLRATVYRLLVEEEMSDQAIRDYLVERYGDFVLYDPPVRADTLIIWLLPVLVLLVCGVVVWRVLSAREVATLAEEDQQQLQSWLREETE